MTPSARQPFRVIQFGTGNFLRGFIGAMLQSYRDRGPVPVQTLVVKPTASYPTTFQAWLEQNGRYHVLTKGQQNGQLVDELQVIEHVATICHPYRDFTSYLALAQITVDCIISNTTEAGLNFVASDAFTDQPATSFPGKLTQLLHARWTYTKGDVSSGYDILPCELVENNGDLLQSLVLRYCLHWQLSEVFINWVKQANRFYNTLVDRIVPGRPELDDDLLARLQFSDQNVVQVEPYLLWAIESSDELATRLPLSALGLNVIFTPDIQRYRSLKVRILNGAHTAMTMWGLYHGIETVGEFKQHPRARRYLDHLLVENILPSLPYPESEKLSYLQDVYDRFENPFMHHRLHDIALNSVAKFNSRLLPTLESYYKQFGVLPSYIVHALALLIRHYRGDSYPLRDEAKVLEIFVQHWSKVTEGRGLQELVYTILADQQLWPIDLAARFPTLVDQCTIQIEKLDLS